MPRLKNFALANYPPKVGSFHSGQSSLTGALNLYINTMSEH